MVLMAGLLVTRRIAPNGRGGHPGRLPPKIAIIAGSSRAAARSRAVFSAKPYVTGTVAELSPSAGSPDT
jgi:hypothetical protein